MACKLLVSASRSLPLSPEKTARCSGIPWVFRRNFMACSLVACSRCGALVFGFQLHLFVNQLMAALAIIMDGIGVITDPKYLKIPSLI